MRLETAAMDAEEDRPNVATCCRMDNFRGLILAPISGSPLVFQQLGVFGVQAGGSLTGLAACDAWFESCIPEVFAIM